MLTPYVDVNFTRLTELSIEGDDEAIRIVSGDERCNVVLFLTEDRKEAIRRIVRQLDLDDEAEARGETAVCADCGELTDDDGPEVIPTPGDRYTVSGPTRDGGFIVRDNETGRNAAFDRRDVQFTFGEYNMALTEAQRLNAEVPAADPRCICGHYQDQHTDTGEASPLHQCLSLGCPCVAWHNQERPMAL